MADYEKAAAKTLIAEGGYANNPADRGGETFRGVARNRWPDWEGWAAIDARRNDSNFPTCLDADIGLQTAVAGFYRLNFWDKLLADQISDQAIAEELFDSAVNLGLTRAIGFLQRGLNALNGNQKRWPDILEDGWMGKNTLLTLQQCLFQGCGSQLFKVLNILQGAYYLDLMRKDPSQEIFALGWLSRVEFWRQM